MITLPVLSTALLAFRAVNGILNRRTLHGE